MNSRQSIGTQKALVWGFLYSLVPLLVLLAAIFLACIVSYFIIQGTCDQFPFRKVISKFTQLFLVLSIFPAMAYLKISREELGFASRQAFLNQLIQGFGLGFITLMPVFIVLTVLKVNVIDETHTWTIGWLVRNMAISLLLALIISLIEEPIFRGILLTGLGRKLPVMGAILVSSIYYAGLHFLSTKTNIPVQDTNLFTGFKLLGEAFANLFNPNILPAFLALLMVGIFLGVLRTQIKASLGLCIGCHTSWVWQIKMSKNLFNTNTGSEYLYLVSSYDGVIGPLVTGWLLLAIAGYFFYQRIK
ncbi:MAG: CPBP family intramembrane metalloprotease [Methylococcales bacterium]|nr:CPBP family intramembrane metalloprotease [Methylococcales bacterium]